MNAVAVNLPPANFSGERRLFDFMCLEITSSAEFLQRRRDFRPKNNAGPRTPENFQRFPGIPRATGRDKVCAQCGSTSRVSYFAMHIHDPGLNMLRDEVHSLTQLFRI
jgi:hypothetical protein